MTMTSEILTQEQADKAVAHARAFLSEIKSAMDKAVGGVGYIVFAGLDKFFDLLTNTDENMGYLAYNHPDNGFIRTDLLQHYTLAEWQEILTDPSRYTSADISFFDVKSSGRSLLIMVAQQATTNIPGDPEQAKRHVLHAIGNVFMGAQFYHRGYPGFQLVYADYTLEEPEESPDMSSYLVYV